MKHIAINIDPKQIVTCLNIGNCWGGLGGKIDHTKYRVVECKSFYTEQNLQTQMLPEEKRDNYGT